MEHQNKNKQELELSLKYQDQKLKNLWYQVWIFVCLIIIFFFWSGFNNSFNVYQKVKWEYLELDQTLNWLLDKEEELNKLINLIDLSKTNQSKLFDCINNFVCETKNLTLEELKQCKKTNFCWELKKIDSWLFDNISLLRDFYLLNKFEEWKLTYDQKKILKNIMEYLMVNDNKNNIWEINIITFWTPKLLDNDLWIYSLPIVLSIDFKDKNDFFTFLNNIEYNISNDIDNILYKISAINYDIVNYSQQQTVNINMEIYFYK